LRAEILAVGDELLSGAVTDTNSSWLAAALLEERGIPVERIQVCGDGAEETRRALEDCLGRSDLLLVTGGLGPTEDDRVRNVLAALAGTELETDPSALERLREAVLARGVSWTESMARQVRVPRGFLPLENPLGQALGIEGEVLGCRIFALPGVPAEMKAMFRRSVLPRIPPGGERALLVLTAAGEPEAALGERLKELMAREEPRLGITAAEGVVRIRVLALGPGARERAEEAARLARIALGEAYAGEGALTLGEVVVRRLQERGLTLAAAESCTGGLLASTLVDVAGASRVFLGGFVAYANQAKVDWVGVPREVLEAEGAVSKGTALALAEGAARRAGADLGVGITGIAGPGGSVPGKPVGTVHLAWSFRGRAFHQVFRFPGGRRPVREGAVRAALWGILDLLKGRSPGKI